MRSLLALALLGLLLAACSSPGKDEGGVLVWHDDTRGVTCFLYGYQGGNVGKAISCLPDSALR